MIEGCRFTEIMTGETLPYEIVEFERLLNKPNSDPTGFAAFFNTGGGMERPGPCPRRGPPWGAAGRALARGLLCFSPVVC
jgi:hypothetical protein